MTGNYVKIFKHVNYNTKHPRSIFFDRRQIIKPFWKIIPCIDLAI